MGKVTASIVGSVPKLPTFAEPTKMYAPWKVQGAALKKAQDEAVEHWLQVQDKAGMDVVTDGEQRRRHYIWGFLEGLTNIDVNNLGKKVARGGRYQELTSVARITGDVAWTRPILADEVRFAKAHSKHPIKVTIPGPMTAADSCMDEHKGRSHEELARMFAPIINQEALALVEAGADVIQYDEPCYNIYVDEVEKWGIETLNRATEGVKAKLAIHICYGYGTEVVNAWKATNTEWGHYERTLPVLKKSRIDQISIEAAASKVDLGVMELARGKDFILGVINVGNRTVETPEQVADRLRVALKYCAPEHLIASTDCGMVPLPIEIAEAKIRALGAGVALINKEIA